MQIYVYVSLNNLARKGLRLVARACVEVRGTQGCVLVWRPCTGRIYRRVEGRSQGTTLYASDPHNARATILNSFYNMECKITKTLATAIVYVSNDVTIPLNSMASQWQHKEPYCKRAWMGPKSNIRITSCMRAKLWIWMFDSVYIKGNQMKLF